MKREEIEIALEPMNGDTFRGSFTRPEVKHCLGFEDFDNFDVVRFGYSGVPIIKIKFLALINFDELYPVQHFNFNRKSSRQGRTHIDTIYCKICSIRHPGSNSGSHPDPNLTQASADEGIRILKIEGYDYKNPEEYSIQFLPGYEDIMSEIIEDLFEDGLCLASTSGGLMRTGIYSV
jgi:hypothetical protein